MINGLEGIPGSGKSYEAVVHHVLTALQSGRKVVTNLPLKKDMFAAINPDFLDLIELRIRPQPIRGTWDATRIDEEGQGSAFELFDDGHTEAPGEEVMLFGHVWDFWCTWKHPKTGNGPLYIIDECHVAYPKIGTDKHVVQWYKLSRHFNADVLLITQNFRDVNESMRGLLAMVVKVRKADVLGKPDHYIRKVHAGYRGAVISTEERKYKPEFFPLYKSHTQGNSVSEAAATDVSSNVRKWKRATSLVFVLGGVLVVWAFWPKGDTPATQVKTKSADLAPWQVEAMKLNKPDMQPIAPIDWSKVPTLPEETKQAVEPPAEIPEPLGGKGVHLAGMVSMGARTVYNFVLSSSGQRIGDATDADLRTMGYEWQPLTHCAGTMKWKGKARAVTCDAPVLAQGAQDRPVVVGMNTAGNVVATSAQGGIDYRPAAAPGTSTAADVTARYR
ncbi:zonular occludens toxin domain-containing protein [Xylophilus ampelinus]|uniref:Zona occludens toxin n=1 Tax=Xylophilus ampelinus TaxID=54067 RepID=A0A318SH62_9BURK|nr:zonular occludens toxin domain-containing protein [Xylophilus ampelinus]MCS4511882.1 zonular occludens toxin [Xylophilus ampelinus]PYE73020.1 zona occludens toxin [Xylophilus ampelinus]